MAASSRTIVEVVDLLLRYIPQGRLLPMAQELQKIEGNKSFKQTVMLIEKEVVFRLA